ncbi:WD40/YVTN/BNR-like repeat-containing protein [Ekhidna sp.]|uniref:WD40/YVTN/BNR-like repeat-containing protein n=1 Tax=Ekhidna sp. TaxID=2608089 RepID=UPI003B5B99E3
MLKNFLLISLFSGLMIVFSCKSDDQPIPTGELQIISGNNQIGIKGEYLTQPVIIKVQSNLPPEDIVLSGFPSDGYGGVMGEISTTNDMYSGFLIDENYEAELYLWLDCELEKQTFEISLRTKSCITREECPSIASIEVNTRGSEPKGSWKLQCELVNIYHIEEHNGITYALSGNTYNIYTPSAVGSKSSLLTTSDFETWDLIGEYDFQITEFNINTDGSMIANTSEGILYSSDGISWSSIDHEIREPIGFASDLLIEDSVYFAMFGFGGVGDAIYRTRDNGDNWQLVYESTGFTNLTRTQNGDLFLFDADQNEFLRSSNSGNNWEVFDMPGSIYGDIEKMLPGIGNSLLILSDATDGFSEVDQTLYSLDLGSNQIESFPFTSGLSSTISDIVTKDGVIYVLSDNTIYSSSNDWEKINGPELSLPNINGLYLFSQFDDLHVVSQNQFFLHGYKVYANFID